LFFRGTLSSEVNPTKEDLPKTAIDKKLNRQNNSALQRKMFDNTLIFFAEILRSIIIMLLALQNRTRFCFLPFTTNDLQ